MAFSALPKPLSNTELCEAVPFGVRLSVKYETKTNQNTWNARIIYYFCDKSVALLLIVFHWESLIYTIITEIEINSAICLTRM